ncbi:MAG: elongation factor G, partial [Chloroflexota bacterium]
PEPVVSVSIEPRSNADLSKLGEVLAKLGDEDPTFKMRYDEETRQTVILGMGELHIDILVERMRREFGLDVRLGKPRVAYKEAITVPVETEGRFIKQFGGRGQYGHVWLKLVPLEKGKGFEFVNKIRAAAVPREYVPAVEAGVREALQSGVIGGYPVVDIQVTVFDGSFHTVDSSELAFKMAGSLAVKQGLKQAKCKLLEPLMKLEVTVPLGFMGEIVGDLNSKRGRIDSIETRGEIGVVRAFIPLAETFGYATRVRSLTEGRGSYFMEFNCYQEMPAQLESQVAIGAR